MENFNQDFNTTPRPVAEKEKSVYLLHLDKARIVILSAIVISIIGITFLIGMKFTSQNELPGDVLTDNKPIMGEAGNQSIDDLFDTSKTPSEPSLADSTVTDPNLSKNDTLKTDKKDDLLAIEETEKPAENAAVDKTEKTLADRSLPVPAKVKSGKHVASNKKLKKDKEPKNHIAKNSKKPTAKSIKAKNNDMMPVSVTLAKPKKGSFAIQVVSYDVMVKAKKESDSLKSQEYDSYIDKTQVNGKTFFRVRIGPFDTKNEANTLLTKLQEDQKYTESYIVIE